jgi:hypothetical protein
MILLVPAVAGNSLFCVLFHKREQETLTFFKRHRASDQASRMPFRTTQQEPGSYFRYFIVNLQEERS